MPAPTTPETVLRWHPSASWLSVHDGRTRIGTVLDTRPNVPRAPAAPSYAFDRDGAFLGQYPTRREAVAAIPGWPS